MSISAVSSSVLPATIPPMLAQLARRPFDSHEHLFELKWEGIRALARVEKGRLRLHNRRGEDITEHFPELASLASRLKVDNSILDGELVCLDDQGRPNLQYLRERLATPEARRSRKNTVHFIAFDALFVAGENLTQAPLVARKNILHNLLAPSEQAQATDFVEHDGKAFFDAICQLGLEGIVAKEKAGLYQPGRRSKAWQKVKRLRRAEFVIGGYAFGGKKGEVFTSLLVGLMNKRGKLLYTGQVTSGMTERLKQELLVKLQALHVLDCPFDTLPQVFNLIYWCRPEFVCTLEYGEFTEDKQLAYPVFVALTEDQSPDECLVTEAIGWPVRLADFA